MSVVPRDGGDGPVAPHKWETIRYALDSNARTVRLVIIILSLSIGTTGSTALVVSMALTHEWPW